MNNLYKMFATDKDAEKDGVWMNLGPVSDEPGSPDMKIKIARAGGGNVKFEKVRERVFKPYRHQIDNQVLNEEIAQRLLRELYADAVVLGWENITDPDGNPLECTTANCIDLFAALPQLYEAVKKYSSEITLFRQQIREEDAKN